MEVRAEEATANSKPGQQFVDSVQDNPYIIQSDELQLLLVALCGKDGTDVEFFGETNEDLDEFIEMLNRHGMNCYIEMDPRQTELENLAMFLDDEEYEGSGIEEMLERDIIARIFVSWDRYDPSFFENLERVFDRSKAGYHRRRGEFYGYPEEDINSFIFENQSGWRKKLAWLLGRGSPRGILPVEALEKYDEETTREERRNLLALTNHKIADTRERLEKQLERTDDIRRILEENGVDTKKYIEEMAFEEGED